MYGKCENCKYAEWEYVDAYYGGYWAIGGCKLPIDIELPDGETEWNDNWGDEIECPFWQELIEE